MWGCKEEYCDDILVCVVTGDILNQMCIVMMYNHVFIMYTHAIYFCV